MWSTILNQFVTAPSTATRIPSTRGSILRAPGRLHHVVLQLRVFPCIETLSPFPYRSTRRLPSRHSPLLLIRQAAMQIKIAADYQSHLACLHQLEHPGIRAVRVYRISAALDNILVADAGDIGTTSQQGELLAPRLEGCFLTAHVAVEHPSERCHQAVFEAQPFTISAVLLRLQIPVHMELLTIFSRCELGVVTQLVELPVPQDEEDSTRISTPQIQKRLHEANITWALIDSVSTEDKTAARAKL